MTVLPFISRQTKAMRAQLQALLATPIVLDKRERDDYVRLNKFVEVTIRGNDLRLRVGLSKPMFPHEPPPLGYVPSLSLATLIDECRDCADPVALSMLVNRCTDHDEGVHLGDGISLARRWTGIEPDNHLAWLILATLFWHTREPEQAVDTLRKGAVATCWREHEVTFAREAVAAMAGPYFSPRQRLCAVSRAQCLLLDRVSNNTMGFMHEAATDPTLRPLIVDMLAAQWRDGDSPYALSWSGLFAAGAGLDGATIATRTRRADAYSWAGHLQAMARAPDPLRDAEFDAAFEQVAHRYAVGERREYEETLAAAGLDEVEAAGLHVASLDSRALAIRTNLMTARPLADGPMRGPPAMHR